MAISFTLACKGAKDAGPKEFTLAPGDKPVRLGRAPGNDIVIPFRGVSQYHAEVRVSEEGLCIRDLSMNGTGVKKADGNDKASAALLQKNTDEALPDGAEILVPMMLKEGVSSGERGWISVQYLTSPSGVSAGKSGGDTKKATPAPSANTSAAPAEQDADEDAEKKRMQFVELLLKTREVSAGTKYEEARELLGTSPAWHAVEENTRKECFDIFVEHLGSHQSQKEKKKKDKHGKTEKEKKGRDKDQEKSRGDKKGDKEKDQEKARGDKKGDKEKEKDKDKARSRSKERIKKDKGAKDRSRSRSRERTKKARR